MPVNYDDRNAVTYGSPCGYNTCGLCQQLWKCQGLLQTKRLKHYFLKYTLNAKLLNETSKSLCNSVIYNFRFDVVISVAFSFLSSLLEEISDYITLKSRKEQMILLIYNLSFQNLPPLYFRNARHKMNIMQRQLWLILSLHFKVTFKRLGNNKKINHRKQQDNNLNIFLYFYHICFLKNCLHIDW